MKIPLEILKTTDSDGATHFNAIISFQDAIAQSSQSQKLVQIQNEYRRLVDSCKRLVGEIGSSRTYKADSHLQWKLADNIYLFVKWIEAEGYVFANVSEALSRDLQFSKSRLGYLIKFRTYYPTIAQVSGEINWSKYQEILDIKDSKVRRLCEKKILSGEIKTDHDVRIIKKKLREETN